MSGKWFVADDGGLGRCKVRRLAVECRPSSLGRLVHDGGYRGSEDGDGDISFEICLRGYYAGRKGFAAPWVVIPIFASGLY